MPVIYLSTEIHASPERRFDLSRSIDLHQISTAASGERASGGTRSGLISMNESVTWKARHIGISQTLTSRITAFDRPFHFRDEQQKGAFKYIIHDHYFDGRPGTALMRDVFNFQSPLGFLGSLADYLFLKKYLLKLLMERNRVIKEFAESQKGDLLLSVQ